MPVEVPLERRVRRLLAHRRISLCVASSNNKDPPLTLMTTSRKQSRVAEIDLRYAYTFGLRLVQLYDRADEDRAGFRELVTNRWAEALRDEDFRSQIEGIAPGYCAAYVFLAEAASRRQLEAASPTTSDEVKASESLRAALQMLLSAIVEARRAANSKRGLRALEPLDWHADPAREDEAKLRRFRWKQKLLE